MNFALGLTRMDDLAAALLNANRVAFVAPAGCGKTHLIAEAVSTYQGNGRQLVLTHTHAGVDAIRTRLKKFKADPRRYRIETIAGWCLRMTSSFPKLSELASARPTAEEWETVYAAAALLLKSSAIRSVVAESYDGLWVDEYQDCTMAQHAVVMLLAEIVPCRILGDPLQAIFSFGETVNWDRDVVTNVDSQFEGTTPWRWLNSNAALGTWLLRVRSSLLAGQDIDLRRAPVSWKTPEAGKAQQAQLAICRDVGNRAGSVIAIHKWPQQGHALAQRLNGMYTSIEEAECAALLKAAAAIDASSGFMRTIALIDFACECLTKVGTDLKTTKAAFRKERFPHGRRTNIAQQVESCCKLARYGGFDHVLDCLRCLGEHPGSVLYRRELYDEMNRAVRAVIDGKYTTLLDAAWAVRDRTRHVGRRLGLRTVSTTLRVKGLEFDHTVVLDPAALDMKNLYVAMTRGSTSLTIVSAHPILRPAV